MNPERPKVSVIIPCYNQAEYLTEAVASVSAQTMPDWECIVVNDGSPDNTREITQSLAKRDSRIRYVEQENGGTSAAKNAGLDVMVGQYVQFLDADDRIHPRKLELQLASMPATGEMAVSYTDFEFEARDPSIEIPNQLLNPIIDLQNPLLDIARRWGRELGVPIHSFLLDARFFTDHGIRFDPGICYHEDYDCWLSVFALHPRLARVPDKLAVYRLHAGTATTNRDRMLHGRVQVLIKHRRLLRSDAEVRRALDRKYREVREYAYSVLPRSERLKLRALRIVRKLVFRRTVSDCQR